MVRHRSGRGTCVEEVPDNYQAVQYQKKEVTIGSCHACHKTSKGGGISGFGGKHGGLKATRSACNICHTSVPSEPTKYPHAAKWQTR